MANKKIGIPMTESDLTDLANGCDFEWTFDGIDVHVFNVDLVPHQCPRCIEDYQDEDGNECKGEEKDADCEECGVCKDCEHMRECSESN